MTGCEITATFQLPFYFLFQTLQMLREEESTFIGLEHKYIYLNKCKEKQWENSVAILLPELAVKFDKLD